MDLKSGFRGISSGFRKYFFRLDVILLGGVLILGILSVINLHGIGGFDHAMFQRQIAFVVAGFLLILGVSSFNYRHLKNSTVPVLAIYSVSVLLLSSTLWFSRIRNIHAWIVIGGIQFEPSEFAKLALVILLAKYFSQRHVHIGQFRHILVSGIYCAIPAGITMLQPDLGSAVIMIIVWAVMLLSVGINRQHLFLIVAVSLFGAYLAWMYALAPYQKDRILAFINPYQDPAGYGYHIIQSRAAIGSGGLFGQGPGNGSQATLGYLPEPYNDFAFSAFVEQFGLFGAVVLLGGVLTVVWRILRTGQQGNNNFARLFCVGIATVIFSHACISAAVNIGLLPITGIPFTFLSYGGSHLLSLSVAIGIVQSIHRHG